jgi:hypothetical protein
MVDFNSFCFVKRTVVPIAVPLSESDPMKRLRALHETLDDLIMSSTLPLGFLFVLSCLGLLSSLVKPKSDKPPIGTLLVSNFPTPDITSKIFGHSAVYMQISAGIPANGYPIVFSSLSFQGNLLLQMKADAGLFPNPEATKAILALVEDELDVLKSCADCGEI